MGKLFKNIDLNNEEILSEISKEVSKGALIIYPTDTVYGLGASLAKSSSLDKIYEVKERRKDSPLIALLSNKKYLEKVGVIREKNRDKIEKLIERFWPGGLTIILDKKDIIPLNMVSNGSSVGVRIPHHEIAQKIIESCGGILATTSANISGEPSPKLYEDLSETIKERVEIIIELDLNISSIPKGIESTIIDMRGEPKILREGNIKKIEIEKIIGKVE